jgi:phage terminase large subunit
MQIIRRIRPHQQAFHKALVTQEKKRFIEIAHRRWGKDEIVLSATCELMHKRIASYWHCMPMQAQARKGLWTQINANSGKRRIDEIFPPEIREKTIDDEMFIKLKCGSTWQLVGSDNYNSLVGAGVGGVVFSEWALANPSAWGYMRPMIEENNGWAAFITTPRGRNHAYSMYQRGLKTPETWFAEKSSIYDTGALSHAQLAEALADNVAIYGEDHGTALFQQEYECSFDAAIMGAFYGKEMAELRRSGRLTNVAAIPWKPIHRAWDIGVRDDTSIWFFQVVDGRVFVLDCYTDNGGPGVDYYAQIVRERCEKLGVEWKSGTDFVPHDARVKEWGVGRTRIEQMIDFKLNPVVCKDASKLDGINAARFTLKTAVFDVRCDDGEMGGVSALTMYRRQWDDDKKAFKSTEEHDWSSHLADAFRYLALSWRDVADIVAPEAEKEPPPGYFKPPPVRAQTPGRIKI